MSTICRISHWSFSLLSHAGRLQLIKSISVAMTSYWMMCFPFPKAVIKKIELIGRVFLWTDKDNPRRKSLVVWKKICRPRTQGGLGLIDLCGTKLICSSYSGTSVT